MIDMPKASVGSDVDVEMTVVMERKIERQREAKRRRRRNINSQRRSDHLVLRTYHLY